ncbi:hypothetical protein [Daejeonella sp.]|uniref:hypothetical protein n=1 Tax=Daejeonella sp. TaxID=2805397 RepID=UPI003983B514
MATEGKSGFAESNSDNSRNNNGTIGGAGGTKREPKGSFHEMTERAKVPEANERGIRENEENHKIGDQAHENGSYAENEIDPNMPGSQNSEGKEIRYPKDGYNHIDNPGGTSKEELDNNN